MNSPQLPLAFAMPASRRLRDFVFTDNAAVQAELARRVTGDEGTPLYLSGAAGSGKSHLLIGACLECPPGTAQYLSLRGDMAAIERSLIALTASPLVAIDDIDAICGHAATEVALFDAFNRLRDGGSAMLLAAKQKPLALGLTLPDLRSRLASATQLDLRPLAEADCRRVMRERARARGFDLDDAVLEFLFRRHARDLGAQLALLDRIDHASLAEQRRVSVPFLRRMLALPANDG